MASPVLAAAPQRLASCTVASDEMAVAILEKAGALGRLVAVSTLATNPDYSNLTAVPKTVAGACGGELESLLKLKPDVAIVATFNRPELLRRLRAAGVFVHILPDFTSLDDIENALTNLGKVLGEEKAASAVAAAFVAERRALTSPALKTAARPRVLQFSAEGAVSGKKTLFDDLVTAAGGVNLGGESGRTGWPHLGAEALAALQPDFVVAAGDPDRSEALLKRIQAVPGYREMPAVKSGRLIVIPDRELSAASPHVLKALARIRAALSGKQP